MSRKRKRRGRMRHHWTRQWYFLQQPPYVQAAYTCQYCGGDLLADLPAMLGARRDHLFPPHYKGRRRRSRDKANRFVCCMVCDKLKSDVLPVDIEHAREIIADRREYMAEVFRNLRANWRGLPAPTQHEGGLLV